MNKLYNRPLIGVSTTYYVVCLILVIISLFAIGCHSQQTAPPGTVIGPPVANVPQVIIETVKEMNWLNVAGILGVGISVAAGAMGWKNFMSGVLGCGSILGLALIVERVKLVPQSYVDALALILMIGVGLLVVLSLYKRVRTLKVKDQALEEIVTGCDKFKKKLTALDYCVKSRRLTARTVIKDFVEAHDSIQNPKTKEVVDHIQSPFLPKLGKKNTPPMPKAGAPAKTGAKTSNDRSSTWWLFGGSETFAPWVIGIVAGHLLMIISYCLVRVGYLLYKN